jgi:hypothetical protein
MVKLAGGNPSSFSSENILPPMHSAIKAFATKKAVMATNSFVGFSFIMFSIIPAIIFYIKFELRSNRY